MKPVGWLSHPLLSALLALAWLLLQQSLAVPQLITAAVLGLILPRLLHGFLGDATGVRSWRFVGGQVAAGHAGGRGSGDGVD